MATAVVNEHIAITPGVVGGEPRVAGHRIAVASIAIRYELMGHSVDEIATGYGLSLAEVHAALAYYYDNKANIDANIREGEAFAEALRQGLPAPPPARTPASAV